MHGNSLFIHHTSTVRLLVTLAAILTLATGPTLEAADSESALTLRINDAAGRPGELVAVVVRTYAPRAFEQGQICINARTRLKGRSAFRFAEPKAAQTPFAVLERVEVFSDAGDASSSSLFDGAAQSALAWFSSPSGSLNRSDGPLAVFYFRLDTALVGGEVFQLEIAIEDTILVDAGGEPVAIEPRAAELKVVAPGAARQLAAESASVRAGEAAQLAIATEELFAVGGGQVVWRYDPSVAAGPPEVSMDPRYGDSSFTTETPEPGRLVVTFQSPDASLNSVPGDLIFIRLPTRAALPAGRRPVWLDAEQTLLWGAAGETVGLELEAGWLDVGAAAAPVAEIFADGFESGETSAWTPVG